MILLQEAFILESGYRTSRKPFRPHFHNAYEMILVKRGHVDIEVSGKRYQLKDHMIAFISNFEEHSINIISDEYVRYYLILSTECVNKYILEPKLLFFFKNRHKDFMHVLPVGPEFDAVERAFAKIMELSDAGDLLCSCLISSHLIQALAVIHKENQDRVIRYNEPANQAIMAIQKYIDNHYLEELRVQMLADMFFINVYYLSHLFKEATGHSPKQYLMLQRLAYAKELLQNSQLQISDIAERSGFSDTNNFIRYFKQQMMTTPNQYRRRSIP